MVWGSQTLADVQIQRERQEISVQLSNIHVEAESTAAQGVSLHSSELSSIKVDGLRNTGMAGGPSLPQISFILVGKPKTLRVTVDVAEKELVEDTTPTPSQETQSREGSYEVKTPVSEALYSIPTPKVKKTYLGDFRGVHLTKVKVSVASYSSKNKSVSILKDFTIKHNSREFRLNTQKFNKYLVIAPKGFKKAMGEFITWKEAGGYIVEVEELDTALASKETVQEIVKEYYKRRKIHFAILVGTEKMVPTSYVGTKFSRKTPSDSQYFTLGEGLDSIPDIFHSRIVVKTPQQLRRILWKGIRYELGLYADTIGFQSIIGVASNEGKNPSDDEYVSSIGKVFKNGYGMLYTHLPQNNIHSNRIRFNKAMNWGSAWVTYMGHGNGTSWPSFNESYRVADINRMENQDVVQPVVIDVACQNGKIKDTTYLGSGLMVAGDDVSPKGAVAYYGGTVNISWHPPAIMAKGIAVERFTQGFTFLGEGLFLGHLYLAKNWDRIKDFRDNLKWYHLQGDPGLKIRYDEYMR